MRPSLFVLVPCVLLAATSCKPSLTGDLSWSTEGGGGNIPLEGRYYGDGGLDVFGEEDDAYFSFYIFDPSTPQGSADGLDLAIDFESPVGDLEFPNEQLASFSWIPDDSQLHTRYSAHISSGPRTLDFYLEWHGGDGRGDVEPPDGNQDPGSLGSVGACVWADQIMCAESRFSSQVDFDEFGSDCEGDGGEWRPYEECADWAAPVGRCEDVPGPGETFAVVYFQESCDVIGDLGQACDDLDGTYVQVEGCD